MSLYRGPYPTIRGMGMWTLLETKAFGGTGFLRHWKIFKFVERLGIYARPLFCRNHFNTHYIPNNTKTLNLKHLLQSTPSRVKLPSCVLFWILNGVSHEKLRSFVKLSPHCSKFGCLMSFCVGSNNTSIKWFLQNKGLAYMPTVSTIFKIFQFRKKNLSHQKHG